MDPGRPKGHIKENPHQDAGSPKSFSAIEGQVCAPIT